MRRWSSVNRRTLTTVIAAVLALNLLVAVTGEPDRGGVPEWVTALERPQAGQTTPEWRESTSTPLVTSVGTTPAEATFPAASRWSVRLGRSGAAAVELNAPGKTPIHLSAGVDWAAGQTLNLSVLDRRAAERLGVNGFLFTISDEPRTQGTGGRPAPGLLGRPGAGAGLRTTLTVDYADFAQAYGAGYGDRLRVVSLRACALAEPVPAGCDRAATPLPTVNDAVAQTLTVEVPDLAASASGESGAATTDPEMSVAAFAVTSSTGGDTGTFAATQLSITGSWQVAPGSGEFGYSYPFGVPEPAAGSAPEVSLNYSSGAIDGLTLGSNTQSSPSGLGWSDLANAFIERSYEPCYRIGLGDLCWKSDNATISLAGISGSLIPTNAERSEWIMQNDPGWRVQRLQNAPYTEIYQKQYWLVTGPDGTRYWFGYGHKPGQRTNSILGVQVLADNPGEPCRGAGDVLSGCLQGWRWYLDRIEDPDANVTSLVYSKETNWYSPINGFGTPETNNRGTSQYDRAALLSRVYYGGRDWEPAKYSGRITFGIENRCVFLNATDCATPAHPSVGIAYPDVPTDLICDYMKSCTVYSPSFFSGRRYSWIRTEVRVGTEWKPVVQYNLIHNFGDGANGVALKLHLAQIQHAAIALGRLNAYPTTKFTYKYFDNRANHGGSVTKAMRHNRLETITNPFGGKTTVTYFRNRACSGTYNPYPRWDTNVLDCFPQSVVEGGFTRTGTFNKYLVRQVVDAPGVGSPVMTTTYSYGGDPAWSFDNGAFARDEDETGWSRWRGYASTTITKGTAHTEIQVYRGWDGDLTLVQAEGGDWVPRGRRDVSITLVDGSGSVVDAPALAGRTLVERQFGTLNGTAGSVLQSRRYDYETRTVFDPGPEFLYKSEWAGQTVTTERVASAPGVFRERRSQTTYNDDRQPTTTLEEGWLDVTGDERCSTTTYAVNADKHMLNYPAVNQKLAGGCDSTTVLSRTETYYDGNTSLTAAPARGNPTRQRTKINSTTFAETTTQYDALGRPVAVTDPNGAVTTTIYEVTAGAYETDVPIRTTVTNALGHRTITEYLPEFNAPTRVEDANGNSTWYTYDEFGRVEMVWLPTEPPAFAYASYIFSYDVTNRAIRSRRLTSESRCCETGVFEETWVIHDGFWRERQSQTVSPVSGMALVSETTYDDRGLIRDETVEQNQPGSPGVYLPGTAGWPNRTRHSYDELGREIRSEWLRGSTVARTTTTAYGVDTVTVTGPDGRVARQRLDGLGRTVATAEQDGTTWVASAFGYDLADRLTSITDPEGNTTTYGYDLAGRRVVQQDPNRGGALYGYDNAGNQTVVFDSLGNHIVTVYDELSRPIERRVASTTGQLLASWSYDTAPGGKGQLAREVSITPSGEWKTEVVGYDIKGRVTATDFTVPAGVAGLAGTYRVSQTYNRADRVVTTTLPAIGGLPQEQITTQYSNLGLPTKMTGLETYVSNRTYDSLGRLSSTAFGPKVNGATWLATNVSYNADQQASGSQTYVAGASAPNGLVAEHQLTFDATGNLTEKTGRENDLAWRECYGYDDRNRLVSAATVPSAETCATGQPGSGARAYAHTYQYSPGGRLTMRVEDGVTTSYTYPAAGSARAMAPTQVGPSTLQWNAVGHLTSRTVAGGAETFSWDVQKRLRSVTGPDGTTAFEYDAAGQRVLRRAPNGRVTAYVAGHEVSAHADGSGVTAVRPYMLDGALIAIRSATGVKYLVGDATGSIEMAIPSGGQPDATRTYLPYGSARSQTGSIATDRGFLGQVEDSSTRLSYLNARYYDAVRGIFISPDAVLSASNMKSLNPYAYSNNNPTTYADPSGNYSAYTFGLERSNAILRDQNKRLIAHIGRLNDHISDLQGIIKKQQRAIRDMQTYIAALEAEIARQATIIRQLQQRVAYLERVVAAQRREISRLRYVVYRQQQIIRYQAGVIRYQAGVIGQLVQATFLPQYQASVLASIAAGRGITSWEGTRLELSQWRSNYLYISDGIGLRSYEVGNIIDQGLAAGTSRADIDQGIAFLSMMAVTTAGENQRMESQREVLGILSDHYEQMAEINDGYAGFIRNTACFAGGQIPLLGTVVDVGCYGYEVSTVVR